MADHTLQDLMGVTMDKIRELANSNTIIGEPITTQDGITILPVSKVTFGVASGGSDFANQTNKDMFGGGSGAGVTVAPVAFLVVQNGNVRTIQLSGENSAVERAITMIPELVDKLTDLLKKQPQKPEEAAPEQNEA